MYKVYSTLFELIWDQKCFSIYLLCHEMIQCSMFKIQCSNYATISIILDELAVWRENLLIKIWAFSFSIWRQLTRTLTIHLSHGDWLKMILLLRHGRLFEFRSRKRSLGWFKCFKSLFNEFKMFLTFTLKDSIFLRRSILEFFFVPDDTQLKSSMFNVRIFECGASCAGTINYLEMWMTRQFFNYLGI